jgi:hypothetical protein
MLKILVRTTLCVEDNLPFLTEIGSAMLKMMRTSPQILTRSVCPEGGRIYIKLLFFASSWSNAMYMLCILASSAHDASENALDTAVKGVLCDCRYIS